LLAVQHRQTFDDQLAQHPQGGGGVESGGLQRRKYGLHTGAQWRTVRQQMQPVGIAAANALNHARIDRRIVCQKRDLGVGSQWGVHLTTSHSGMNNGPGAGYLRRS